MNLPYSVLKLMIKHCSVLTVLSNQLDEYENLYGCKPQLIVMHRKLKGALVREVYRLHGDSDIMDTVIEPVWIGSVPLIFEDMKGDYLALKDNSTGKQLVL